MELLLLLLAIVIGVGALSSFAVGWRALKQGMAYDGSYAAMLYLLAINLCEPLINVILIGGCVWQIDKIHSRLLFHSLLFELLGIENMALTLSAPMAVLLAPAIGLFFHQTRYRRLSAQLLGLGLVRWSINMIIFGLTFDSTGSAETDALLLVFGLVTIGTAVLGFSAVWGGRVLRDQLAQPLGGEPQTGVVQAG
jgi:hypothetical protein